MILLGGAVRSLLADERWSGKSHQQDCTPGINNMCQTLEKSSMISQMKPLRTSGRSRLNLPTKIPRSTRQLHDAACRACLFHAPQVTSQTILKNPGYHFRERYETPSSSSILLEHGFHMFHGQDTRLWHHSARHRSHRHLVQKPINQVVL